MKLNELKKICMPWRAVHREVCAGAVYVGSPDALSAAGEMDSIPADMFPILFGINENALRDWNTFENMSVCGELLADCYDGEETVHGCGVLIHTTRGEMSVFCGDQNMIFVDSEQFDLVTRELFRARSEEEIRYTVREHQGRRLLAVLRGMTLHAIIAEVGISHLEYERLYGVMRLYGEKNAVRMDSVTDADA